MICESCGFDLSNARYVCFAKGKHTRHVLCHGCYWKFHRTRNGDDLPDTPGWLVAAIAGVMFALFLWSLVVA